MGKRGRLGTAIAVHLRVTHGLSIRCLRFTSGVAASHARLDRLKTMTLDAAEFIRRFLLHVLPSGFHRIRHYGLFVGVVRAQNIERVRQLLAAAESASQRPRAEADSKAENILPTRRCPCCGGRMIIVETFEGPRPAQSPLPSRIRIDTS